MAAASISVLIYFIHHIATSIRIEMLLEKLAVEGRTAVDRLVPERLGGGSGDEMVGQRLPADFDGGGGKIEADSGG